MKSLLLDEARARFQALRVNSYDVTLDLAADPATFASTTRIELTSQTAATFLDLKPVALHRITLDGRDLPPEALAEGRYPLDLTAGDHELVVVATMPFRNDGEGLHRSTDPADGRDYVYGMCFMDAAPTVFACFDQPDLKAPYTLHVKAPTDWVVVANAPGKEVQAGQWEFDRTPPLSTYFVTLVAGDYHVIEDDHDGIPLRLLCRRSLAAGLDRDAEELFSTTKNAFDEFHRMFGIRYPFGKYDQAFVPEFNAGAMENPGCVTFRDIYVYTSVATREQRILRATTMTHEMAHQWFGNIVTPVWWDDLWLNESFAEYAGNRVAAVASPYADALAWSSLSRKNWGLTADTRPSTHPIAGNGAVDALAALQDFDGISYAKGSATLRQLAEVMGEDVFLAGVRDHIEGHRFGNATMHDLFDSWERAGADHLGPWEQAWLLTAGVDRMSVDRTRSELVRTVPTDRPADRRHVLELATWDGSRWARQQVATTGDRTPVAVTDQPVLIDSGDVDWVDVTFDEVTAAALPALLPRTTDPVLRTTVWNTVRNGVHQVALDPAVALDIVCAGLPQEEQDVAVSVLGKWTAKLLSVSADPAGACARLHDAFATRGRTAPEGSLLRLAAFQGEVLTSASVDGMRAALAGDVPAGVELDRDLRWRIVKRLALLGGTDRSFLDAQLDLDRDAASLNDWSFCRAALADAEAKEWAWARFTGEVDANAYELEAIGHGMWQPGQEDLLAPYVDRYFAEIVGTAEVRAGWALASSAEFFYPITALADSTVAATEAVCAVPGINPGLERRLADRGDEVRRRVAIRRRYAGA